MRSWSGLRIWVPSGAIRVPAARSTDPGRPSSIVAAPPSSVERSSDVTGAQTRNGTPAAAAASASGYVPAIAITSPLAATRSAATSTAPTSPAAMHPGAPASVTTACGTPAWRSSHAATREPSNNGRVSATSA